MRPYRAILAYLAAVILGAALLSPLLYSFIQNAAAELHHLESLANYPFSRYVQRSLLFVALLGLYPLLKHLGLGSWARVGLPKQKGIPRHLIGGFLLGFISLGIILILALALGGRQWDAHRSLADISRHAGGFILTALIVSCIEEIFFRGAIFGALRTAMPWQMALWASSLFYAALHFLGSTDVHPGSWTAGFVALGQMAAQGFAWSRLIPAFFTLTCAGLILGLAYQRFGTLYFSIGLHAGWIFWLKCYSYLTEKVAGAPRQFWGTGRLIDGWAAFLILLSLAALAWFLHGNNSRFSPLPSASAVGSPQAR